MKQDRMKIVLTGGHAATPGIAVVEELRRINKKLDISWIGAKIAIPGTRQETTEYKIFPKIGVNFYPIEAGKIQTKFTRYTIPLLFKVPLGFIEALIILLKIRPNVVLSFGGFASFPVAFWSCFLRIPVILHEQTVAVGRASLASSFFATKIVLAREESLKFFPKKKSVVIGNPVMRDILKIEPKIKSGTPKTILVMGGSRGSQFIDELILKVIRDLAEDFKVIHITSRREFERVNRLKGNNYQVLPFVSPFEMAEKYRQADIVISRSGANTVSELMAVKRPCILIPLPGTFMDEQLKNALYAKNFGIAEVLEEKDATPESLLGAVDRVSAGWDAIVKKVFSKKSPDMMATGKLANIIYAYIL